MAVMIKGKCDALIDECMAWLKSVTKVRAENKVRHMTIMLDVDVGVARVNGKPYSFKANMKQASTFANILRRWGRLRDTSEVISGTITIPRDDVVKILLTVYAQEPAAC